MSDLATVYAEVCAKCPECNIEDLIYKPRDGRFNNVGKWLRNGHRWDEADVQALIEARWTKWLLARGYRLEQIPCIGYTFFPKSPSLVIRVSVPKPEIWQAAAARILH